jgi:hypothetical protein
VTLDGCGDYFVDVPVVISHSVGVDLGRAVCGDVYVDETALSVRVGHGRVQPRG